MRVMVLVKATKASEAGVMPDLSLIKAMGDFNDELVKAGVLLAADGLKASSHGVRVHFDGTKRTVSDGPFAETRELVAGFWLWEVRSMDEAIEWARRCPNPHADGGELEIRPIFSEEEFLALLPPELRESQAQATSR
ncbi:YciI family protein [Lysobacter claricitrinus]|uniref:YciI family protein n=1 Tax=Lysobacter claricitrinus TaxID=3367728 RepID=UPI0037DBD2BF